MWLSESYLGLGHLSKVIAYLGSSIYWISAKLVLSDFVRQFFDGLVESGWLQHALNANLYLCGQKAVIHQICSAVPRVSMQVRMHSFIAPKGLFMFTILADMPPIIDVRQSSFCNCFIIFVAFRQNILSFHAKSIIEEFGSILNCQLI